MCSWFKSYIFKVLPSWSESYNFFSLAICFGFFFFIPTEAWNEMVFIYGDHWNQYARSNYCWIWINKISVRYSTWRKWYEFLPFYQVLCFFLKKTWNFWNFSVSENCSNLRNEVKYSFMLRSVHLRHNIYYKIIDFTGTV